jgi:hypothetical protein
MAASRHRFLVEGIVVAVSVYSLVLVPGNPRDLGISEQTMATLLVLLSFWGYHFRSSCWRWRCVVERCAPTTLRMTGHGGVVQHGLVDGRGVMDLCRAWVLPGGINDIAGKGYAELFLEDGPAVDGGDAL